MTYKLSHEDVLRMVGEPAYYEITTHDGIKWVGENRNSLPMHTSMPLYTEAQLLAMYAAGAEEMREQAAHFVEDKFDFVGGEIEVADAIRALPITTNTL